MVKNVIKDVKYKEYYIPLSPDIRYTLVLGAFPVKMTLGRYPVPKVCNIVPYVLMLLFTIYCNFKLELKPSQNRHTR